MGTNYTSAISAVIVSETCQTKLRKVLGAVQAIAAILGFLLANITGLSENWRTSALILSSIPFFASATILFFPDTPYWLIKMGRSEDAKY